MDDQPDIPINLRGVYFQGQPCLENIPSFPDWKPGDGPSMNDQSWKRPPTHLFEQPMDFHALSGTELPRKTATSTFSKSVSVSVELPSPINEKVRYKQRRAQNRASQKAFRQRQAEYTHTLELELEELRSKYDKLCTHVRRIKQAVEEMCMEGWETSTSLGI